MNGWRGPGALAIVFGHFAISTNLVSFATFRLGPVFVDMFFVFSGIVISQAYAARLSRPAAIPEYVLRRIGRIWPVQVVTLAILVSYELVKLGLMKGFGAHFSSVPFAPDGGSFVEAIPSNLLLIHSLGLHDRETWNFPSWSLSVEFAVYFLFALLCLLGQTLRHLLSVLAIAGALVVLAFVAPYHMRSTFDYGLFRCLVGFLAGTLLRDIVVRWHIPQYPFPTFVEILAVVLFGVWLVEAPDTFAIYLAPLVLCLFGAAFVSERGALSRVLMSRPFQLLAEGSFSIYMVHAIVLIFVLAGLHEYAHLTGQALFSTVANPLAGRPGAPATVQIFHSDNLVLVSMVVVVYVAGVGAAAFLMYRLVEAPGRAAFGRLAKAVASTSVRGTPPLRQPLSG